MGNQKFINRHLVAAWLVLQLLSLGVASATGLGDLTSVSGGTGVLGALGAISGSVSEDSLLDMFDHLSHALPGVTAFLQGVCYIMGFGFVMSAVWKLKKFGHRTAFMHVETGLVAPFILFLMGVLLMYTPGLFKIMNYTLFGHAGFENVLAWESSHTGAAWQNVVSPMVGIVQVIGFVSFIRGWLLLARATNTQSQPGNVSKGIIHVVAGILALNVTRTIDLIRASLGVVTS